MCRNCASAARNAEQRHFAVLPRLTGGESSRKISIIYSTALVGMVLSSAGEPIHHHDLREPFAQARRAAGAGP